MRQERNFPKKHRFIVKTSWKGPIAETKHKPWHGGSQWQISLSHIYFFTILGSEFNHCSLTATLYLPLGSTCTVAPFDMYRLSTVGLAHSRSQPLSMAR